MQIVKEIEENSIFANIPEEVEKLFLSCLHNATEMEAKLLRTKFSLFELPFSKSSIYGMMSTPYACHNYIGVITYNPEMVSKKLVAYAIAHELSHLLMHDDMNELSMFKGDISAKLVDGEIHSKNFNLASDFKEAMADAIGKFVVSKGNFDDSNGAYEMFMAKPEHVVRASIIQNVEAEFGTRLMECSQIDEVDIDLGEKKSKIKNGLWYYAVTHDSRFIEPYFGTSD